ncbi:hypothetical protein GOBAR_AA22003 [Gossypium barbadense]|uniref:Uncharacterized protein n=1 Tax=Gossypium barbadense TaxID=3634 RepID=A0A2P5X5P6_GOSBA|nr:hypothetical protein GOBAR_AA22003 [Gossypium barbadense]
MSPQSAFENSGPAVAHLIMINLHIEIDNRDIVVDSQHKEVAQAKLKLLLSNGAHLVSLTLIVPRGRAEKQESSWSRLDVSDCSVRRQTMRSTDADEPACPFNNIEETVS